MSVNQVEVRRYRKDTYPFKVVVKDKETGQPLNITGNTFTMSVASDPAPSTASYVFQSTGTITDAVNGKVSFPITTQDADRVGTYYFDVVMDTGSERTTILRGILIFEESITK
jgi:hypothetical protein